MPYSTPTNIKSEYLPGEKIHPKSFNNISESLKSSVNSNTTSDLATSSGSFGKNVSVNERLLRPPIFAKITNVTALLFDSLNFTVPGDKKNYSNCYGFYNNVGAWKTRLPIVYAYSWVEVTEDLNINRLGEQLFPTSSSFVPAAGADFTGGSACLKTSPIIADGKNFGTPRKNPAFHVNNELTYIVPGVTIEMFYGAGDYMLFNYAYYRGDTSPYFHTMDLPYLGFAFGSGKSAIDETRTVNQNRNLNGGEVPTHPQDMFSAKYTDFEQPWLEAEDHP